MIIQLENEEEIKYSNSLATWIEATIESPDPKSIKGICSLWDDESWEEIVERFNTEGSTWYVWWMDGVRAYMRIDKRESKNMKSPEAVDYKKAIEFLNDLVERDRMVMHCLTEVRVPCQNSAMLEHPTVQILVPSEQEGTGPGLLGFLGILNGLFGIREDGMGYICGEFDDEGILVCFKETPRSKT
jgi:hypothetical protein